MKKKILCYTIAWLIAMNCCLEKVVGQTTNSGPISANTSVTGLEYLGWVVGTPINLDIRHNAGLNIDFYRGPAAVNQSMTIPR